MALEVKYPILFIFLIPAFVIVFLYFKQTKSAGRPEKILIGCLRGGIFFLLIFALTIPQIQLPVKGETVIFLTDRSASFEGLEDDMFDWLNKSIETKKAQNSYGAISFADGAVLEQSLTKRKTVMRQFNTKLASGETNLEEGIQFAASLMPKGGGGRIVLLSDGNETMGNASEAAGLLRNQKIELDYAAFKQKFREDTALTKLEVPPTLFVGENTGITVNITSTVEKLADIRISLNNQEILQKKVMVNEGQNEFSFSHKAIEPGMAVYKAEIGVKADAFIENNTLYAVSNVKGTPKVLVVQGNQQDQLTDILKSSGLFVDTLNPEKLPTTLAGFLQYQSIIFNNVPGTKISGRQMNLIEKAVKEFGKGFVMLGGEDSFGLGGYFKTPIEKLLPVDMDIKGKKEMPSLGLVIVIDRSGSMSGNKLTLAKEAAARSVELLREEDTLGFIAFDDRPWTIVETGPLKNKKKVVEKIRSVPVGGGTNIYPALAQAYRELENLELQRKHIILLTDGQSATEGDYQTLIADGKENNITLSTVALGSDADRRLLEGLSEQGNGRFYDVTDASIIPSILSRETVMTTRTYIEDTPFYPEVRPIPEWASLFKDGIPKMNAYVAVTAKKNAEVPMISVKKDPVLAQWHYGLGKTLAFTSDVTGKWSGDFARWGNWPQFLNQLVAASLPTYDSEPFRISLEKKEGNTVLHLTDPNGQFLPMEVSVVSQNGKLMDTNVKLVTPGDSEVIFPNKPGMYFLRVKQTAENGEVKLFQTGFTVPYSEEYLLKGTNKQLLKELAASAGGRELKSPGEAFRALKEKPMEKKPISEQLLLAAFLLLSLEILLRRFGLKPFLLLYRKLKVQSKVKSSDSTVVFEQLSKAKEKVNFKVKNGLKEAVTDPQKEEKTGQKGKKQPSRVREKLEKTITAEEKEARMKRLLDAKKRKT